MSDLPKIKIEYCRQCKWLLRSAWMAQELLNTFEEEIGGVTLTPGTGGIFEIKIDGELVWSRKEHEGFPDIKQLKQIVRDVVSPDRDLGHTDRD